MSQCFTLSLMIALCFASGDVQDSKKGHSDSLQLNSVIVSIGLGALSLLILACGAAIYYYYISRTKNEFEQEDSFSLEIGGSVDEAFPHMKPAYDPFTRTNSQRSVSTISTCKSPRSPSPCQKEPVNFLHLRQGSMAILAELNEGFPIDLSDEEAANIQFDDYGNTLTQSHSVIFDYANDVRPRKSSESRSHHNKNDLEFHQE